MTGDKRASGVMPLRTITVPLSEAQAIVDALHMLANAEPHRIEVHRVMGKALAVRDALQEDVKR